MSETEDVETTEEAAPKKAAVKKKPKSYFLTDRLNRFLIDDESYIEHTPMDEGAYEGFQDLTSTIKVDRDGDSTEVDMKLGATRRYLLENLVIGWNLVDADGSPVPFSHKKLRELPPHIIGLLVEDIYLQNPILRGESEDSEAGN
jgi:hypothetical protein